MKTWARCWVLVAVASVSLTAASAALALKLTPTAPQNGHLVVVAGSSPETYVRLTISVDLAGCFINPQVQPYKVELFSMNFSPLNGRGAIWNSGYRGLLKPDHEHLIEDFTSGSPSIRLIGDARIVSAYIADGELLRWSLPALCADAVDPNQTDRAVATGTLRIQKQATAGSTKPPKKKSHKKHPRSGSTTPPFRITRIDSPASVQENGPRGTATIHWSGRPTFPVTMHDAPASCPGGLTCSSETQIAVQRANPLYWDAWWCAGSVTSNWTLDYWFWLTDAKGRQTPRVRKQVTCDVG